MEAQAPSVSIRSANSGDLRRITEIRVAGFASADSFITKLGAEATYRYLAWMYQNSSDFFLLCAVVHDEIAGYGILARADYRSTKHFIRAHWPLLLFQTLRRPRLLFSSSLASRAAALVKRSLRGTERRALNTHQSPDADQRTNRRACVLLDTTVHPRFQRMGIGTKILFAREELAKSKGFNVVTCTVHKTNTPSIKLHERYGYTVSSQTGDAVRMEKTLT